MSKLLLRQNIKFKIRVKLRNKIKNIITLGRFLLFKKVKHKVQSPSHTNTFPTIPVTDYHIAQALV